MELVLGIAGLIFGLVALAIAISAVSALSRVRAQCNALEKQLEKVSKTISAHEKQIHALSRQRSNPAGGAIVPMVSALAGTRKNGWGPTLAVLGWNLFRMAMESRKKSNKVQ